MLYNQGRVWFGHGEGGGWGGGGGGGGKVVFECMYRPKHYND